jgi:DNA invertase Pin-like site-specific DNA recombinase
VPVIAERFPRRAQQRQQGDGKSVEQPEPSAHTGTSIGPLMIAVLGGLADVERDLIRTRTAEGRSRAQKRGQRMGRKPKLTEARKRRAEGATLAELARSRMQNRARGYHYGLTMQTRCSALSQVT